jgi:hypothetical protein
MDSAKSRAGTVMSQQAKGRWLISSLALAANALQSCVHVNSVDADVSLPM